MQVQKITPYLWFDNKAEEAMKFYTSVFKDSKILNITYYPDNVDDPHMKDMSGKVMQAMLRMKKIIVADLEKAYEE